MGKTDAPPSGERMNESEYEKNYREFTRIMELQGLKEAVAKDGIHHFVKETCNVSDDCPDCDVCIPMQWNVRVHKAKMPRRSKD